MTPAPPEPGGSPPGHAGADVGPDVEEVLAHDGVTHVVRVGGTVRRPVRPFTTTVWAYLDHLRAEGFTDVPDPLGLDEQGREVLGFVPGDVPVEPLPPSVADDAVMAALGRLLRRAHDAAAGWSPPPDARWGSIPGGPVPGAEPLFAEPELVAHQDYCPGNVVFRDGLPAALIDFDLARPTTRVADLVNALHHWAPLTDPSDRSPALRDVDALHRSRVLADAYGLTAAQRRDLTPVAVARARNSLLTMRAAADVDPVFRRWWDEGVRDRLPRTVAWLSAQAPALARQLLDG